MVLLKVSGTRFKRGGESGLSGLVTSKEDPLDYFWKMASTPHSVQSFCPYPPSSVAETPWLGREPEAGFKKHTGSLHLRQGPDNAK